MSTNLTHFQVDKAQSEAGDVAQRQSTCLMFDLPSTKGEKITKPKPKYKYYHKR